MRTKSVDVKEQSEDVEEKIYPVDVLSDADREELELLRAERSTRLVEEKRLAEAQKNAAEMITLNLPPAAGKGIVSGGRMFLHGRSYQVSNDVKWALEEAERRCWAHEASLHESENKGRKKTYRAV